MQYDNKVVLGDFSLKTCNPIMLDFLNDYDFTNLIKRKTCLKEIAFVLKILIYRDFEKIMLTNFQTELISKLNSCNSYDYCIFEKSFVEVLDKHAPKIRIILRGNQKP